MESSSAPAGVPTGGLVAVSRPGVSTPRVGGQHDEGDAPQQPALLATADDLHPPRSRIGTGLPEMTDINKIGLFVERVRAGRKAGGGRSGGGGAGGGQVTHHPT
jgi:hypothetical protein